MHNRRFLSTSLCRQWLAMMLLLCCTMVFEEGVFAEGSATDSLWSRAQDTVKQTWQSENYELFIPVRTWHNPSYYSDEQLDSFNNDPLGLGIGKYRFDEYGNWHALFTAAFLDSHEAVEPYAGYAFEKMWRPMTDFRVGVGYSVGVTMRRNENYLPFPAILPLMSVEYQRLSVQATYIPGYNGNGNILFTWLRWQIK